MNGNIFKKICFVGGLVVTMSILFSCASQPNPLVGAWADNRGAEITLMADNTFMAKINDVASGQKVTTEGSYTVLLNVISFVTSSGYQRVSEWDIRGNMLYLTWVDENMNEFPLTLYKIRN